MSTNSEIRRAVYGVLFASALLATGARADDELGGADVVVVTGSRIARTELEASVPVQVINSKSIEEQGSQNVSDILAQLPAVGTALVSRTNSNFLTSGNGVASVNLRNAGAQRTLVLVNGRRIAAGIGGNSVVDLNDIPTDLISNVEVITGGASAVYGSEAIAGVVNFTLKDNFEGFSFRGQAGTTSDSDNDQHLASLTWGTNFLDRGNVTLNVQYDDAGAIRSTDRDISKVDNPNRSATPPQGVFRVPGGGTYTFTGDNTLKSGFASAVDGYNRNSNRLIAVPLQRVLYSALAHFDFSDNLSVFAEGSYADVGSSSALEPLPTSNADAVDPTGNSYAGLTVDNPFIPAAIRADMIAHGGAPLGFSKRMNDVFDRSNVDNRNFYRGVLGLRGKFGEDWQWEAYVNNGGTLENVRSASALRDRYFFALDAVAGPTPGSAMCRDAAARAAGCVPFNPFGFNSVSPESAAYITDGHSVFSTYRAEIEQSVAAANVNGSLFELPAGSIKVAAGLEYRKEKSTEVYDAATQAGNTTGNQLTNTIGDYHVSEAYLETVVPLLKDMTAARSLDVEGAVRFGDYSTVGNVVSWKGGITWAPLDDLRVRGVYSRATRAPNIGELFQGLSQTFPTGLTDPCEGITATSAPNAKTAAAAAYCRSIPAIAQQIAANGTLNYQLGDVQSIQGFNGGNANLKEEVAKTLTLGIVLTPQFLPNFNMTIDYFDIKVDNAITPLPRQTAIDQCADSGGASPLCSFITREPTNTTRPRTPGTLYNIDSLEVNAASIHTTGIDTAAHYRLELPRASRLELGLAYTYLDKLTQTPVAGQAAENELGQLNSGGRLGAGFQHRASLEVDYTIGALTLDWHANFQSRMKDTLVENGPSLDDNQNTIGSYIYHNAQVRYAFSGLSRLDAYVGVDNIFDKKPPLLTELAASQITGTETAADSYDPIGRFIYGGVQLKF